MAISTEERRNLWRARLDIDSAKIDVRLGVANALALQGLNCLFLVNGGAVVALFTLLGQGAGSAFVSAISPRLIIGAFALFSLGLVACIAATTIGYWSQQLITVAEQESLEHHWEALHEMQPRPLGAEEIDKANALVTWALGAAVLSLLFFMGGAGLALFAAFQAA